MCTWTSKTKHVIYVPTFGHEFQTDTYKLYFLRQRLKFCSVGTGEVNFAHVCPAQKNPKRESWSFFGVGGGKEEKAVGGKGAKAEADEEALTY